MEIARLVRSVLMILGMGNVWDVGGGNAAAQSPEYPFDSIARPVCICVIDAAIERGLSPTDLVVDAEQLLTDATVRASCAPQVNAEEKTGVDAAEEAAKHPPHTGHDSWTGSLRSVTIEDCIRGLVSLAKRDFGIRMQVVNGLTSARAAQNFVSSYYLEHGLLPADLTVNDGGASSQGTPSTFVASMEMAAGSIAITFGNDADAAIRGKSVMLTPYRMSDNSIIWNCGNGKRPSASTTLPATDLRAAIPTSINDLHLPAVCRP